MTGTTIKNAAGTTEVDTDWKIQWQSKSHGSTEYGELFFKRAVGEADEMESSKAAAKRIAKLLKTGETLADIGCGVGHYLRSMQREIKYDFVYKGFDATEEYIQLARKAFPENSEIQFKVADIFDLQIPDVSADVTMCNNVLLHLPSVSKPLKELVRITRKHLLIRMLIADASYVVKRVTPEHDGNDFDLHGNPQSFHYLNIYSQAYVAKQLTSEPRVKNIRFELDKDFNAAKILDSKSLLHTASWNATEVADGMQRSGMLFMPWTWVDVTLES